MAFSIVIYGMQRLFPTHTYEIDSSKLIKIFTKHPEMKILIFRIHEILHDPVITMDSLTVKGSYVLLGSVIDNNNHPVLVSIIPKTKNRRGMILNVQKISSTYAKENAQNILDHSVVRYINPDNKITTSFQKLTRLQLPFVNLSTGGYIQYISQNTNLGNENPSNLSNIQAATPDFRSSLIRL